jgi:hypothetical protein
MGEDYNIQPVTQNCSSSATVVPSVSKTSNHYQQMSQVDSTTYQIQQNQSMDTVETPKPLVGGKTQSSKKYTLLFYKKKYTIYASTENDALHLFFKNKTYKKSHVVHINKNIYTVTPPNKKRKSFLFTLLKSNKTSLH